MNPTGFIGRNGLAGWAILNPRVALAEKRLMDEYRKEHPVCECCGTDQEVQIHHGVPLWKDVSQAGTNPEGRYRALCVYKHNCHLYAGHSGNFGKRYVENLDETIARFREAIQNMRVVHREDTLVQ